MTTKPKFKCDALAAIHASATALQRVGAINQTTRHQFDETCLATSAALAPEQIKKSERMRMRVSLFLRDTSTPVSPRSKSGNQVANNPVGWRSSYW